MTRACAKHAQANCQQNEGLTVVLYGRYNRSDLVTHLTQESWSDDRRWTMDDRCRFPLHRRPTQIHPEQMKGADHGYARKEP
jgi:hypothetical protein